MTATPIAPDLKVGFVLSPDFTILPFAGFIDALRHAADEADRSRQIYCRWSCVAPETVPVRSSCGVSFTPDEPLGDPSRFDYVVVIGGLLPSCLGQPAATFQFLRDAAARGVTVVGLCTGSFVMAGAGLLDGRRCAVHVAHRRDLVDMFPSVIPVTDEIYVFDHGCITCPGGTAAIDLATTIITHHCGRARALKALNALLVDKHRAAHHVPRRPWEALASCGDRRVRDAVVLMERNIGQPFGIEELARRVDTTSRQLHRAFAARAGTSPAAFWRYLRLTHAQWLLLHTERAVTRIAHECGFADCAHFTRWFKRSYGETPHAFRIHRLHLATRGDRATWPPASHDVRFPPRPVPAPSSFVDT